MLAALGGEYFAAEVQMLLTSPNVHACLLGPPDIIGSSYPGVRNVVVDDDCALDACIASLRDFDFVQLREMPLAIPARAHAYVAYLGRSSPVADSTANVAAIMPASELAATTARIHHVNISSLDVPPEQLARSPAVPHLRSLDIARLQLENEMVIALISSGYYRNLRWLDLSGNPLISFTAVEAIAIAVNSRKLPRLEWLDLLWEQTVTLPPTLTDATGG